MVSSLRIWKKEKRDREFWQRKKIGVGWSFTDKGDSPPSSKAGLVHGSIDTLMLAKKLKRIYTFIQDKLIPNTFLKRSSEAVSHALHNTPITSSKPLR